MRTTTIIVIFLVITVALFALSGFVISFLWNLVMPSVFHAPILTWGEGVVISLLLSVIGGAFRS